MLAVSARAMCGGDLVHGQLSKVEAMLGAGGMTGASTNSGCLPGRSPRQPRLAGLFSSEDHVGRSSGSLPLHSWDDVLVDPQLPADPLDTLGVEPDQRDGEPGPQLVLELFEDVAGRDDQDLVASTPPDELGEDQADSSVLPRPTASAISSRGRSPVSALRAARRWYSSGLSSCRSATARPVSVAGIGVFRSIASR